MARRGASRPSAAGTRVTSVGQSATWVAQQKNLKRIFDVKFITSTPERQGARQLKNVGDTATDTATSLGHPLNHQQDLAIGLEDIAGPHYHA